MYFFNREICYKIVQYEFYIGRAFLLSNRNEPFHIALNMRKMYNKKRSCTISRKEKNFATFQSQNLTLLDIRTPCDFFFKRKILFSKIPYWIVSGLPIQFIFERKENLLLHLYVYTLFGNILDEMSLWFMYYKNFPYSWNTKM